MINLKYDTNYFENILKYGMLYYLLGLYIICMYHINEHLRGVGFEVSQTLFKDEAKKNIIIYMVSKTFILFLYIRRSLCSQYILL